MQAPTCITIDYETEKIEGRPVYPPRPVGVSIKWPGEDSVYWAWGHPTDNNCTYDQARGALLDAWLSEHGLLFFNAKFDVAVACEKMGMEMPAWDRIHDAMFLAFLNNPHSRALGLKPLAEELLDWAPEEQDAIKDWILEHKKYLVKTFPQFRKLHKKTGLPVDNIAPSETGAWIATTPGSLCGPYAEGDTDRTWALFAHLYPLVVEMGMLPAYERERMVLPIFMENEREGICADVEALKKDVPYFQQVRDGVDEWLRARLNAPDLNIDSDADWAEVLSAQGIVDDDKWTLTKTKKRSVSKTNLPPKLYNDPEIASAYGYRNRLGTALTMFLVPWLNQSRVMNGRVSTNWHQTRGGEGGTRTGRPSTSNPNFLNISKKFEDRSDGYVHPDFLDVPNLPLARNYILPDPGCVFMHRDFDGQELRVFADFEQGELFEQFQLNPNLDPHAFIGARVNEITGTDFERTIVKNINFGKIYGAGLPRIMELIKGTRAEAQKLSGIHDEAMPGIALVNEEIKRIIRAGDPIRTWGGRCYFEEPPGYDKTGRWREYLYKLLNYLVQGSAADITKEAMIRWYHHPRRDPRVRFLVTVYDEINASCPLDILAEQMQILREVMEGIELDIDMLSSPKVGKTWGSCQKPKKGEAEEEFIERMQLELAA